MKKVAIGIVIGFLMAMAVPVGAETFKSLVSATLRPDYKLEIDGRSVVLQNPVLASEGKSYLPVREMATLLGKEVEFKDGVIKLSDPEKPAVLIESKEDFDKAVAEYSSKIEEFNRYLASVEIAIEQLGSRPETKDEEMQILYTSKAQYEATIAESQKAIDDLKAQYPEYAKESAK